MILCLPEILRDPQKTISRLLGGGLRFKEVLTYCNIDILIADNDFATLCNKLQHTATQQHEGRSQHPVINCNTLQHTATHCNTLQHTATHCNTLQHTATHCNTLQHSATHCNTLQHTTTHCNTPQHTATHNNTLQHTVPHCTTLQHTATHPHRSLALFSHSCACGQAGFRFRRPLTTDQRRFFVQIAHMSAIPHPQNVCRTRAK